MYDSKRVKEKKDINLEYIFSKVTDYDIYAKYNIII